MRANIVFAALLTIFILSQTAAANPLFEIESPAGDICTNLKDIPITGTAKSGAKLHLDAQSVINDNGKFNVNVQLREGVNLFTMTALDGMGNVESETINITLDTVPPSIAILKPENNTVILQHYVIVSGTTDKDAIVVINGSNAINDNGRFHINISLIEGFNNITATAVDKVGNTQNTYFNITVDTTPPFIEVLTLNENTMVTSPFLNITCITEKGANVTINGVKVKNNNGTLNSLFVLSAPLNKINITITDKAGNSVSKVFIIKLGMSIRSNVNSLMNMSFNREDYGIFNKTGELITGKYVSFGYNSEKKTIENYALNNTIWFDEISISGFLPDVIKTEGPVAMFEQGGGINSIHSIHLKIHDNPTGVMFISVYEFENIYKAIRERLLNRPHNAMKITREITGEITVEPEEIPDSDRNYESLDTSEWQQMPIVTMRLSEGVTAEKYGNVIILRDVDGSKAYIFNANYTGGTSTIDYNDDAITAELDMSMIIFRNTPIDPQNDFADVLHSLLTQHIGSGLVAAEISIDNANSSDIVLYGSDLHMHSDLTDNRVDIYVNSNKSEGKLIIVNLMNEFLDASKPDNIGITFDNIDMPRAHTLEDILDPTDDLGRAEYINVIGNNGKMFVISIPHFSEHIITIKLIPKEQQQQQLISSDPYVLSISWALIAMFGTYVGFKWRGVFSKFLMNTLISILVAMRRIFLLIK